MTDKKRDLIITIVLSAIVAVLVALGFNVTVAPIIQPEQPESRAIRERIAIDTRDDSYLYNGAKLLMYSDDHSTQKASIDGATGNAVFAGTLQTTGAQTFSGLLNANGGFAVDTSAATIADGTGNTVISGTLGVTDTATFAGAVVANGGLTMDTDAVTIADTSGNTQIKGTLGVTGSTTLAGATSSASIAISQGDMQTNDFFIADVQGALTLTDNGVITPTGTYQPLTEAGDVTVTVKSTGYVTGTLLVLINTANQTVIITDTASYSAPSLGQYDTASFIWDGTQWVQIGEVDN